MDDFTNNAAEIMRDITLKRAEMDIHTADPLEVGKGQYLVTTNDQKLHNITAEQRKAAEILAPWRENSKRGAAGWSSGHW